MRVVHIFHLVKELALETVAKYTRDSCHVLAAALAYHSFFSIFPLILFLIYFGTQILQVPGVIELLNSGLIEFLPTGGEGITEIVISTLELRGSIGIVGGVSLLWSASAVFTVLELALNRIWGAPARAFWRTRLVAAVPILILSLVFLASVSVGQFVPRLLGMVQLPGQQIVGTVFVFTLIVGTLTLLYTSFPNKKVPYRPSLYGALFSATVLLVARVLFDVFINSAFVNYGAVYGSLAWVVSLALWTYVVAAIFLAGAELGSVLAGRERAAK
jgi:membrane protein